MTARVKKVDLGKEVDKLAELEAKVKKAKVPYEAADKAFKEQKDRVMELLEAENLTGAKGTKKSVSITEEEVAQVSDWEKFWNFVFRGKHSQLLQRRVSNPAFRELLGMRKGKDIPGASKLTTKRLSINTIK